MEKSMAGMNVLEVAQIMDKFEQQVENHDLAIETVDQTLRSSEMQQVTNPGDVDELIQQVALQNSLELHELLPDLQPNRIGENQPAADEPVVANRDPLEELLG
eukprot:TRINITY_DN197_c0_g1_i2.p1 TRINITY_DN197_c0_g1~~TRINITY_DN197_c0_g1_i2.p1  ORF type:complete len:103 (-),score=26.55 TRINITY_DN197_c0_g1_i2:31-339(-)